MRGLPEGQAIEIIEAYHAGWSKADVKGMMELCHRDIELRLFNAAPDGGTLHLSGKSAVTDFLVPISIIASSATVPIRIRYADGVARTQVAASVRHKATGHSVHGTYRQIIRFDGRAILGSDEYHDTSMMRAFWDMVREDEAIFKGIDPPS